MLSPPTTAPQARLRAQSRAPEAGQALMTQKLDSHVATIDSGNTNVVTLMDGETPLRPGGGR